MFKIWTGDPSDQARGRVNDTGQGKIIEWISKAWNEHELKLPVFFIVRRLQDYCVLRSFAIS